VKTCDMPSRVSDATCVLEAGHEADSPNRFHRFAPVASMPPVASPEMGPGGPERPGMYDTGDTPTIAHSTSLGRPAGAKICDDCGKEYAGPAYYTFHPKDCKTSNHRGEALPHAGCTGNLCPRCAGPYLEPDRASDPRRQYG